MWTTRERASWSRSTSQCSCRSRVGESAVTGQSAGGWCQWVLSCPMRTTRERAS